MNLTDQQKIRLGACAWKLDEWRGGFYPPDLPEDYWLEFYARYFPAVEVDCPPGGAPTEETVRHWMESTPASFRFAFKLPREITHACRLRDCSSEFNRFLRAVEPLGAKLHVLLVQLPPTFAPQDGKAALRSFLEQLPRDYRFAIEFRHPGWHKPQIIHLLHKHRVCWVWADTTPLSERNLAPFELWPNTTDFLYLRFLGDYATKYSTAGEPVHQYGKLLWKREAALDSWTLKIERHLQESRSVWGFVSDHFEGFAPETCQRLAQRLSFDLPLPSGEEADATDPGQLELFAGADEEP
ncbi:MAG: DUF72 domain-containing protein [Verrucomicrobiota bacterium]|nr:DUF72 domain-containing protein [Verrucomicrobiota bacterium]